MAAPTFGAEGADGRAPVTKAQEGRERGAPAKGTTSGGAKFIIQFGGNSESGSLRAY
jgi:hypothetical protein